MAARLFTILREFRQTFSGDPDMDELVRWLEKLRLALGQEMPSNTDILHLVQRYMRGKYRQITKTIRQRHKGIEVARFGPEMIEAQFRPYLAERINASVQLIKLNREEEIAKQLRRFAGWATGAAESKRGKDDFAELEKGTRKALSSQTYVRRRVCIDQGHKLLAAIDDTIALQYGAIAKEWRHIIPHAGYDSRKEHLERNHKVYAVKGSPELKEKHMKVGAAGYVEDLPDQPGELPYCSCFYRNIYDVDDLPADMRVSDD